MYLKNLFWDLCNSESEINSHICPIVIILTENIIHDTTYWNDMKMMNKKIILTLLGCPTTQSASRYVTMMLRAQSSSHLAPGKVRAWPLLATKVILLMPLFAIVQPNTCYGIIFSDFAVPSSAFTILVLSSSMHLLPMIDSVSTIKPSFSFRLLSICPLIRYHSRGLPTIKFFEVGLVTG